MKTISLAFDLVCDLEKEGERCCGAFWGLEQDNADSLSLFISNSVKEAEEKGWNVEHPTLCPRHNTVENKIHGRLKSFTEELESNG